MKDIIIEKIEELIELVNENDEIGIKLVLLSLKGAILADDDKLLAHMVGEFTKNTLMPRIIQKQNEYFTRNN
jgi:hypothetical protein